MNFATASLNTASATPCGSSNQEQSNESRTPFLYSSCSLAFPSSTLCDMNRLWLALAVVLLARASLTSHANAQLAAPAASSQGSNLSTDILSDTKGADVSPYIRTTLSAIKSHWLPLVAHADQPPLRAPDETAISLTIAPDGHLIQMKMEHSTGNAAFDRAAWASITSARYSPLPSGMQDSPLKMRIHFPAH